VVDLDATVVFAASEKENAKATYKGGVGFVWPPATTSMTCWRSTRGRGNATSNCAADNITLLDLAVSRLPGPFRRRLLVRLDGAGFSHDLLEHIAAGGGKRGRCSEFSVGWACTDREADAIDRAPKGLWQPAIDQSGNVLDDTFATGLTGLMDLDGWQHMIPGLRIIARDEPLHPRYRKRATDREKQQGPLPADRYQHPGRAGRLAGHPGPIPRPCRERRQTSQGPRPEPVAIAALEDQRGMDPGRGPGIEPARLLPAPGITRR
jgi:hypothetical protein